MPFRVLRLIEYVYPTAEAMIEDMERWSVPATGAVAKPRLRIGYVIRSATLPAEFLPDGDAVREGDDDVLDH